MLVTYRRHYLFEDRFRGEVGQIFFHDYADTMSQDDAIQWEEEPEEKPAPPGQIIWEDEWEENPANSDQIFWEDDQAIGG